MIIDYNYQFDPTNPNVGQPRFKAILIPHLHPGFVSYGSADPSILCFMFLCWCRMIILIEATFLTAQEQDETPGTIGFCECILHYWRVLEGRTDLEPRINQAQNAMNELVNT